MPLISRANMEFIIINQRELSALSGLPHIQQLTYIQGIKPFVDYKTKLVGIRRGISYQSISEALYVEPHSGIKKAAVQVKINYGVP